MRFTAALLLASVAGGASPASRSSPAPLDSNPGLARSGCVAVMETLEIMLRNPPAEMANRMVEVPGYDAPQPYTSTEAFLEETLRAVCGSLALAQYRPTRSFWGVTLWQENGVPDYTPSKPVEPRLAELCRRMVRSKRRKIAAAVSTGEYAIAACDAMVGQATRFDVAGQLEAIAAAVQADLAGSAWRLLPFAIVAFALPFVLKPIVTGTPPLPEPRGAAEPGDADYGAPDTAGVGCVPGLTGASTGSVPRKQRRKA